MYLYFAKLCSFEYYENNLNKIPIYANIFIIYQGVDDFGNGNLYIF